MAIFGAGMVNSLRHKTKGATDVPSLLLAFTIGQNTEAFCDYRLANSGWVSDAADTQYTTAASDGDLKAGESGSHKCGSPDCSFPQLPGFQTSQHKHNVSLHARSFNLTMFCVVSSKHCSLCPLHVPISVWRLGSSSLRATHRPGSACGLSEVRKSLRAGRRHRVNLRKQLSSQWHPRRVSESRR